MSFAMLYFWFLLWQLRFILSTLHIHSLRDYQFILIVFKVAGSSLCSIVLGFLSSYCECFLLGCTFNSSNHVW